MGITVGLCAIGKNEGPYIEEWVDYHLDLGFDTITLYDNDSTDGGMDRVRARPSIEVRPWTSVLGITPQLAAYGDYIDRIRRRHDWVMFLDLDEFLNLKLARSIKEFLADFAKVDGVAINWRMFGSSGRKAYENMGVIDRFQKASVQSFGPNAQIKTVFRPKKIIRPSIHSPYFKKGARFVDTLKRPLSTEEGNILVHDIQLGIAQINHYFTKSAEEFEMKRLRGRADFAHGSGDRFRAAEEFISYDRNEEEDTTILRLRRQSVDRQGR